VNVLLIAEEAAGVKMLRALKARDYRVVAVMANPAKSANAGATMWAVAKALGYTTWDFGLVKDPSFAEAVVASDVDIVLNVHSLALIDGTVLGAARYGGYNLHPGPLPRYAGLNSVSWALYRGETTHGVTIHRMEAVIDGGAIAYQEEFPVSLDDTALTVSAKCVEVGVRLMLRLLRTLSKDPSSVPAREQDLSQREFFGRGVPCQGRLSWAQPAARAVDFVRACDFYPLASPWGHPRAQVGLREIGIVKASRTGVATDAPPGTVGDIVGRSVRVACGDEWISVAKVDVDGRFADAAEVLRAERRLQDGDNSTGVSLERVAG
jgi:methionyl-tRNA formyltransferase